MRVALAPRPCPLEAATPGGESPRAREGVVRRLDPPPHRRLRTLATAPPLRRGSGAVHGGARTGGRPLARRSSPSRPHAAAAGQPPALDDDRARGSEDRGGVSCHWLM